MSDYYSLPTTLGAAKLAAAANNNQALTLSHMAFGDANGIPYLPTSRVNATNLVNERYRVAVQFVVQDTQNPNVYIIKARIPANIGGFDVNEIGIFDTEGELIYLANYPRTFKPQITQGAGGELTIKLHVMTSHNDTISIILDPHVITLTQGEGDNRYALKTELDSEAITRENNDLALAVALAAEITNRENADNNLQTQINNLTLSIMNKAWPIGSVYENEDDMRNPAHAELLGFGTWIPTQQGRTSVGFLDEDDDFGVIGQTGGAKNIDMTLTVGLKAGTSLYVADDEVATPSMNTFSDYINSGDAASADDIGLRFKLSNASILSPYVVSKKWKRTA